MRIINPLYNLAFTYLMENNDLAKKVLSVILEFEIEEVTLCKTKTILPDERIGRYMLRFEFEAVIKETDGSRRTVLIELQKSKFRTDILRFKNELYAKHLEKILDNAEPLMLDQATPSDFHSIYPIIGIYILGYNLDDLPYLAVTVNGDVINSVNKEKVQVSSFFIEHLTYKAHIIQVLRLPPNQQTLLEKFLVLFNQASCTDDGFILNLKNVPAEFEDIARYLEEPIWDDNFRRNLGGEDELDIIFEVPERRHAKEYAESLDSLAAMIAQRHIP